MDRAQRSRGLHRGRFFRAEFAAAFVREMPAGVGGRHVAAGDPLAEDFSCGAIRDEDAVVAILQDDADRKVLDQRAEAVVAFLQGLDGRSLHGDVRMGPDHAQRTPVGGAFHDLSAVEDPFVGTVLAPQPVLGQILRRLAPEMRSQRVPRVRDVGRMDATRPLAETVADLVVVVTEHLLPARAVVDAVGGQVPIPDAVPRAVEGVAPA